MQDHFGLAANVPDADTTLPMSVAVGTVHGDTNLPSSTLRLQLLDDSLQ